MHVPDTRLRAERKWGTAMDQANTKWSSWQFLRPAIMRIDSVPIWITQKAFVYCVLRQIICNSAKDSYKVKGFSFYKLISWPGVGVQSHTNACKAVIHFRSWADTITPQSLKMSGTYKMNHCFTGVSNYIMEKLNERKLQLRTTKSDSHESHGSSSLPYNLH